MTDFYFFLGFPALDFKIKGEFWHFFIFFRLGFVLTDFSFFIFSFFRCFGLYFGMEGKFWGFFYFLLVRLHSNRLFSFFLDVLALNSEWKVSFGGFFYFLSVRLHSNRFSFFFLGFTDLDFGNFGNGMASVFGMVYNGIMKQLLTPFFYF